MGDHADEIRDLYRNEPREVLINALILTDKEMREKGGGGRRIWAYTAAFVSVLLIWECLK